MMRTHIAANPRASSSKARGAIIETSFKIAAIICILTGLFLYVACMFSFYSLSVKNKLRTLCVGRL